MGAVVEGYQVVAIAWSLVGFTLILVLLRLCTRISRSRTYQTLPAASDVLIALAWLSFLLQTILDTIIYRENFFDPRIDAPGPTAGAYTTSLALKIYYVQNITYLNCVYAVKASMLALYEEFFPQYMKKLRLCVNVMIWFLGVTFFLQAFLCVFWCIPVSRNWSMDARVWCSCWSSFLVNAIALTPHFLSDVIIYILPLPVLYRLTLPRKQKIGLIITFCCGFACILFAILFAVVSTYNHNLGFLSVFAILEQTYAIIVGCCPLFRAFLGEGRRLSTSLRFRKRTANKEKRDFEVGVLVVPLRNDQQRHDHHPPPNGNGNQLQHHDRAATDSSGTQDKSNVSADDRGLAVIGPALV